MKIEAGQWWETRGGERVHIRYVAPEDMEYPVFAVYRAKDGVLYSEALSKDGHYWGNRSKIMHTCNLLTHLPDCTGWDWEPPKPVDPGEGWRLLEVGEIRQTGDEFRETDGSWTAIWQTVGVSQNQGDGPVRRRIKPDVPPDWKLIGGVPGGMLYFKPTEGET